MVATHRVSQTHVSFDQESQRRKAFNCDDRNANTTITYAVTIRKTRKAGSTGKTVTVSAISGITYPSKLHCILKQA